MYLLHSVEWIEWDFVLAILEVAEDNAILYSWFNEVYFKITGSNTWHKNIVETHQYIFFVVCKNNINFSINAFMCDNILLI